MQLKVFLHGFAEGRAKLTKAQRDFKKTVASELKKFGDKIVADFQLDAYSGALGVAAKARDDGKPPLIESQEYIDSYRARIIGQTTLVIAAEGENDKMSNAALGDILEYGRAAAGWGGPAPPRPHIRPLKLKIEKELETGVVGKKVFRVLLES